MSYKEFLFQKFLIASLHVICGTPPPPNQKSWLRAHMPIDFTFSPRLKV